MEDDLFKFEVPSLTVGVEMATRHQALGVVMTFNFDPLGIISPNALLGKMCLQKFCEEMKVKFTRRILWTNSSVSLYQIKNRINRQKAFVANRVSKIHELTSPYEWRWTPGDVNCADCCSHGILEAIPLWSRLLKARQRILACAFRQLAS